MILVGDPEIGLVSVIRWVFMEKIAKNGSESLVKTVKKTGFRGSGRDGAACEELVVVIPKHPLVSKLKA